MRRKENEMRSQRIVSAGFLAAALAMSSGTSLAAVVTRGPYLQQTTSHSVIVRWRTDVPVSSVVHVGLSPESLDTVSVFRTTLTTEHEVFVETLAPAVRYYYSIGSLAGVLAGGDADHTFKTAPPPGTRTPTRVWVIGDAGTKGWRQQRVRDAFLGYPGSDETDLWLSLGDIDQEQGTDAQFQASVFDMYPMILRRLALWPAFGNHEAHSSSSVTQTGPYFDIFTLPRLGQAGGLASGTEAYYSFDHANVHFVVLDTQARPLDPTVPMLAWLRNDLQATRQDWIVAYFHHPPYSKGSNDSDVDQPQIIPRQVVLPILEQYGVDLVMSGHSHSYERSMMIDGHYGFSSTLTPEMVLDDGGDDGTYEKDNFFHRSHRGTVYVVAGTSGGVGGGTYDHPVMAVSLAQMGSLILDIDGQRLDATFLSDTGVVRDSFSIEKPPLPCNDGIDNDGDGAVDEDDPNCASSDYEGRACGLGFEIALLTPLLRRLTARRRARSAIDRTRS
jgi:acid phosphatase type 7